MRSRRAAANTLTVSGLLSVTLTFGALVVRGQSEPTPSDRNPLEGRQHSRLELALFRNLNGSVWTEGSWYPRKPEPHLGLRDKDSVTLEGRLRLESWLSMGRTRLDLAGWLEYGSVGDARWTGGMSRLRDRDDRSRPAGIERLVVSRLFGAEERWELAAGKDLFHSSVGVLGALADRHSVGYDANDLLNPKQVGVWQVRAQHFGDEGQLTLAVLPVFEPPKKPVVASRWFLGQAANEELIPANVSIAIDDDLPGKRFPELGWLLRYARQSPRWDWFVLGYRGFCNYATYELLEIQFAPGIVAVLAERYAPCWQAAAGVSTSRGAWEFHGEGLYCRPDGRRSDEFLNYVIGTTVRCARLAEAMRAEDVALTVEYLGEVEGREAEQPITVSDPELFRMQSAVLAQLSVLVNADLTVTLRSLHELHRENAHYGRIELKRRLRDNLHLTVAGEVFDALDYRAAGWNRNDRLQVRIGYTF